MQLEKAEILYNHVALNKGPDWTQLWSCCRSTLTVPFHEAVCELLLNKQMVSRSSELVWWFSPEGYTHIWTVFWKCLWTPTCQCLYFPTGGPQFVGRTKRRALPPARQCHCAHSLLGQLSQMGIALLPESLCVSSISQLRPIVHVADYPWTWA